MTRPPNAIAVWLLILGVLAAVALFVVAVAEPVGDAAPTSTTTAAPLTPQTVGEPIPTPVEENP